MARLWLTRQAFEQETQAASLIASALDAEPTRSVLHRSAASLAIECINRMKLNIRSSKDLRI